MWRVKLCKPLKNSMMHGMERCCPCGSRMVISSSYHIPSCLARALIVRCVDAEPTAAPTHVPTQKPTPPSPAPTMHPTAPTAQPTPAPTSPLTSTGPCTVVGNCVQTSNYGVSNYGSKEKCTITAMQKGKISSEGTFETEARYDKLVYGNKEFEGSTGPSDVSVDAGDTMVWSSDSSTHKAGWKICISGYRYCI